MDRDFDNTDDMSAIGAESAAYFEALSGAGQTGPSWKRQNWPVEAKGELISALDGKLGRGRKGRRRQDQGQGRSGRQGRPRFPRRMSSALRGIPFMR